MNIFEISEEFGLSVAKLRKMDKRGVLRLDSEENKRAAALRHYLARNQSLTVAQLMCLIETPAIYLDLGKWAKRAKAQVDGLGAVEATAAPLDVTAYIDDAARGDAEAIGILMRWLQGALPNKLVPHAWIATRLLLPLPENLRAANIKLIPIALLNVRKQPEFAGWWRLVQLGGTGRNQTFYEKPYSALDL